jgi:hypothetical protein
VCVAVTEKLLMTGAANMRERASTLFTQETVENILLSLRKINISYCPREPN